MINADEEAMKMNPIIGKFLKEAAKILVPILADKAIDHLGSKDNRRQSYRTRSSKQRSHRRHKGRFPILRD